MHSPVSSPVIYLDNGASTNVSEKVVSAMRPWVDGTLYGNAHAGHCMGSKARAAMDQARGSVLKLFHDNVTNENFGWSCVFTSGATESNNWAIKGVVFAALRVKIVSAGSNAITILTSPVEHSSVDKSISWLKEMFPDRVSVVTVPVDGHGVMDLARAEQIIKSVPSLTLATCVHVVAETGAVQPIFELARLVKRIHPSCVFHTDAAQSVGKVSLKILRSLPEFADLITVAGHKMHAPKGVGCLLVRDAKRISPLLHGAGQENGLRGGTENVAGIVGFGAACEEEQLECDNFNILSKLVDCLESELRQGNIQKFRINSTAAVKSPYTLNVSISGLNGPRLVSALGNVAGTDVTHPLICISAGSACHSRGPPAPSKVLAAMGIEEEFSASAIRISLSRNTTEREIEIAARRIAQAAVNCIASSVAFNY